MKQGLVYFLIGSLYFNKVFSEHLLKFLKCLKIESLTHKNTYMKKKLVLFSILQIFICNNHFIIMIIFHFLFSPISEMLISIQSNFVISMFLILPIWLLKNKIKIITNKNHFIQSSSFLIVFIGILLSILIFHSKYLNQDMLFTSDSFLKKKKIFNWLLLFIILSLTIFYLFWIFFRDESQELMKKLLHDETMKDLKELPKEFYGRKNKDKLKTLIANYKDDAITLLKMKEFEKEIKKKLKLKYSENSNLNIYFKFIWNFRVILTILKLSKLKKLELNEIKRKNYFYEKNKNILGSYLFEDTETNSQNNYFNGKFSN